MRGLGVAAFGLGLLLAGEARADGPCDAIEHWTRLEPGNAYGVPTDGVLLLSVRGYSDTEGSDADALARTSLAVSRDDAAIAGALELTDVAGVLAWRPAGPLEPGEDYVVEASLDNSPESDAAACAEDTLTRLFTMIVEPGPSAPLVPPALLADVRAYDSPWLELDTIACCEGTRPVDRPEHGSAPAEVEWFPGHCAPYFGTKLLNVAVAVQHGLPPATAALVARQVVTDDQPGPFTLALDEKVRTRQSRSFCQRVVLKNLATGVTATSETLCHGVDIPDLGAHDIDPLETLSEWCPGAAQTCEVVEVVEVGQTVKTWDLERCTPWPSGAPEDESTSREAEGADGEGVASEDVDGCACATGERAPTGLVSVALLVLASRRRRAGA
ncbi:hypothetical protein [Nannocystis punicea]|uniref:MYXO-CTERM domain-containing protein n=1 Tax=Nannocystis punicea TaxID=2995304 RepID=A0ABY7GSV3_9BACT|nr:hypothetical protein [Nannocystis poenicansa]WAS89949.1 hypothetical protein O0S08_27465 [Nannocystis poenicansa]